MISLDVIEYLIFFQFMWATYSKRWLFLSLFVIIVVYVDRLIAVTVK